MMHMTMLTVTWLNQYIKLSTQLIDHVNGLIDGININKIIHSNTSYDLFPACKDYIFHTGTTYKYSNTI